MAAAAIPVIDISAEGADQASVAKALVDAAVEYGFVYIKNTGKDIGAEQIDKAFEMSRVLFSSSPEEKSKCKIQKNNRGWSGLHTETLDPTSRRVGDSKEAFNFGPFELSRATQPIPCTVAPYQPDISAFRSSCDSLCRKLLLLFGIGLGVSPPSFFESAHPPTSPSGSTLRFLYYPPRRSTTTSGQHQVVVEDVRAGAHSDYGSLTLLFRLAGQAGLELLTPSGEWKPVPVRPAGTEADAAPPILVNIGDLLSYWTNGLLRSTVHRVAFAGDGGAAAVDGESSREPRYSIAFFCHPANETRLSAVPSERVRGFQGGLAHANEGNPYAERKVMTADEHLQMRLQASYLQLYEKKQDSSNRG